MSPLDFTVLLARVAFVHLRQDHKEKTSTPHIYRLITCLFYLYYFDRQYTASVYNARSTNAGLTGILVCSIRCRKTQIRKTGPICDFIVSKRRRHIPAYRQGREPKKSS